MSEDVKEPVDTEIIISNDNITDTETGEVMSIEDLAASLKSQEQGMEITSVYYDFIMAEETKCYYIGDLTIKGQDGQKVPAVKLLLEDSKIVINASAVVVSTLNQYRKMKAFSITKTGEEKSKKGKYFTYKIFELVSKN